MSDLTSNRKIDSALNTSVVSKHKPLTYPKKVLIPQNASLLNNDNIFKATKTVANKTSTQTDELVNKSTYQKIDEVVTGGLEAGATLITGSTTGLAGRVIGIAQGLSKSIISGEFGTNEGANIVEQEALKFQSAVTYSPKTKKGQSYLNRTGEFLAPLQAIPIVSVEASVIANSVRMSSSTMVFNKGGALVSKGVKSGDEATNVTEIIGRKTNNGVVREKNTPLQRPTWRQSEIDIGKSLETQGFKPQVSFKDGIEVPYGTKGSTRPDFFKEGTSVEVKNYNVETSQGRSNLVRNVSNQAKDRAQNLSASTAQRVDLDVRGQNISRAESNAMVETIVEKSNSALKAENINILR